MIILPSFQGIVKKVGAAASDPDADAFFTATGITDPTIKTVITNAVIYAKANGLWNLCDIIYPMVGGTAVTHSFNLRNPATFRLTFNGGWTHSATGAKPNGINAYAVAGIIPGTLQTVNDTHYSYYSRDNNTNDEIEWGMRGIAGFPNDILLSCYYATDAGAASRQYDFNTRIISAQPSTKLLVGTRVSNIDHRLYRAGVQVGATDAVLNTQPVPATFELYLCAFNNFGSATKFSSRECAFASVGKGLVSANVAFMNTMVENIQTGLGRAV